MQYDKTKYKHTNINESTHNETGPVWQNPMQRTVRTAHQSVHNFSTQYNTETEEFWQSPSLPPDNHHSLDIVYWSRRGGCHTKPRFC